jgi:hypothetical protein
MEVDEEQIYIQHFAWGFCRLDGLAACWIHWSNIDEFVIEYKSKAKLCPSPPLGVDSADTSQLPKEKNLLGQFQYIKITQPGRSTVTPLYQ